MLEIQHLTKYYRNNPVVNDVTFNVKPGEVTGYLGPNGSGKSTTVKIITALIEPSAGKVLLDGKDIRGDLIDIGAESTRPYGGMAPVTAQMERERLEPVLSAVIALGKPVSIDTMKADIADWAIRQGAAIANDVWGLHRDPNMAHVIARHGVPVIVMHNRHEADPSIDIIADMNAFFERSLEIAAKAGVRREQIVLDPGIGFGKTPEQSIIAVAQLHRFKHFGLPILIALSRKRFIASIVPSEPHQRLSGSIAAHVIAVQAGAAMVRTHDVAETLQALRVAEAIWSAQ